MNDDQLDLYQAKHGSAINDAFLKQHPTVNAYPVSLISLNEIFVQYRPTYKDNGEIETFGGDYDTYPIDLSGI